MRNIIITMALMFVGGLRAETLAGFIQGKIKDQTLKRNTYLKKIEYDYTFSVDNVQYRIKIEPSDYKYDNKFSENNGQGFDGAVVTLYTGGRESVKAEIRPNDKSYSFIATDGQPRTNGEQDLFDTDDPGITSNLAISDALIIALGALLYRRRDRQQDSIGIDLKLTIFNEANQSKVINRSNYDPSSAYRSA